MNEKEEAIEQIIEFLKSDEKVMFLTGTNHYDKHKLIMAVLNKCYKNVKILFRTNHMSNISYEDFVGFAGIKKKPKTGEWIKISNNYYSFDSINRTTWKKSDDKFDFAILYPIDSAIGKNLIDVLEDLTEYKDIGKLFLISWVDNKSNDYYSFYKYYDRHVIYDK